MNGEKIQLQKRSRSDLQQTLQTLPYLFDRQTGIIQSVDWYQVRYNDPQFTHCMTTLGDIGCFTGRAANRYTGGTALTKETALVKAIGESVERYSADLFAPDDLIIAPYHEVRSKAVDPRRFILFRPDQYHRPNFPFKPLTESDPIGWIQGFSLTRNEPALVPATIAHIGYEPQTASDRFELAPVSGYACGNTMEEAILSGIFEVIERDAFMVFWYNWLPVPAFDLRSATSPELQQTLDRYHSSPVRLFCADITTDIQIPAILTLMISQEPGWPAAVIATSAGLDVQQAITHALYELAANHLTVRWYLESGKLPAQDLTEINEPEDHGLLYTDPKMLPNLAPMMQPRKVTRLQDIEPYRENDIKECIDTCVQRLAKQGLEVLVVDLTSADMAELGFKVVKVIIPGMQPLDFGLNWQHLGGKRIYEVPQRLGYRKNNTEARELNLFPHPFP